MLEGDRVLGLVDERVHLLEPIERHLEHELQAVEAVIERLRRLLHPHPPEELDLRTDASARLTRGRLNLPQRSATLPDGNVISR